ncbi:Psy4p Ecym_7175 [Eremothecium cymbalariae DBVPG|uniref:Serine/threonine-protein phosphatase 4 regulatory subunit 2 n=1 Tax=Eremothecium cymbalariae (strain CBS 270.75 / DBVPG 7215 / KCTC 17166 / NRRL Y-17582) TaxID=931890 RepID=G8JW08_ERECY|nr:hypothetical protein Ecym_7175 [Eremothecium cymbalariae DBVPG\
MGIKSEELYENLTQIVIDHDSSWFQTTPAKEFLPQLLEHMSITIPHDIFVNDGNDDLQVRDDMNRLRIIVEYMNKHFAEKNIFPFTIQRICELCYDPLKYFKSSELTKFVNAIEKSCMVRSGWCKNYGVPMASHNGVNGNGTSNENMNGVSDQKNSSEDISISKIPWLDSGDTDDLKQFIEKIESIVSVNFGYDDDDDEDGEDRDIIIQEYYEGGGEDENEDEDEDYVEDEDSTSEDEDDEDEDEERSEQESEREYVHNSNGVGNGAASSEGDEQENMVMHNVTADGDISMQDKNVHVNDLGTKKRTTTDLDEFNFQNTDAYPKVQEVVQNDAITPKRSKLKLEDGLFVSSPLVDESSIPEKLATAPSDSLAPIPQVIDGNSSAVLDASKSDKQVSPLVSPSDISETTTKMTAIAHADSPLQNRPKKY